MIREKVSSPRAARASLSSTAVGVLTSQRVAFSLMLHSGFSQGK
jgi:hypothetical protein